MKILYNTITCLLLFSPILCLSQEVSTLANVTANGGISVDDEGNIYVAHFSPLPPNPSIGKNIYKIKPDGEVSIFVDGQLNVGSGNSFDNAGFLYQSNFATGKIYKIDTLGNVVDDNYATINGPVGITLGPGNVLFVCGCGDNTVKRITSGGTLLDFASGTAFNCANGITTDDNGNIYTTNFSDGRITKIVTGGGMQTLGSTPAGNGHIAYRSNDQMLYIASYSGNRIYKMDLSGNVELFAGTGSPGTANSTDPLQATFDKPNGIAFSPNGCSLYITQDGNVLREIKFADASCTTSIQLVDDYVGLNIYPNPASDNIYIENTQNIIINSISIFDVYGKLISEIKSVENNLINISYLNTGIYSFMISINNGEKLVKKIAVNRS